MQIGVQQGIGFRGPEDMLECPLRFLQEASRHQSRSMSLPIFTTRTLEGTNEPCLEARDVCPRPGLGTKCTFGRTPQSRQQRSNNARPVFLGAVLPEHRPRLDPFEQERTLLGKMAAEPDHALTGEAA
jgi:hypothetical protein